MIIILIMLAYSLDAVGVSVVDKVDVREGITVLVDAVEVAVDVISLVIVINVVP